MDQWGFRGISYRKDNRAFRIAGFSNYRQRMAIFKYPICPQSFGWWWGGGALFPWASKRLCRLGDDGGLAS